MPLPSGIGGGKHCNYTTLLIISGKEILKVGAIAYTRLAPGGGP